MSRKKKYKPSPYLSCGGEHDNFSPIYSSMVKSEAFRKLTASEKIMVICCALQVQDQEARRCLYNLWNGSGKNVLSGYFVFPAAHMKKYGINQANGSRTLDKLCQTGFIKIVERNKECRQPNVYSLCDEWKNKRFN